MVKKQK